MKKYGFFRLISLLIVFAFLVCSLPCITHAAVNDNDIIYYGDVDGDGAITAVDALFVLQYSVKKIQFTQRQIVAGDVINDGEVTPADALCILQYAVQIVPDLPSGELIPEESSEDESSEQQPEVSYPESSIPEVSQNESSVAESSVTEVSTLEPSEPEELILTPVSKEKYHCYNQLNSVQKSVYNIVYENISQGNEEQFSVGKATSVSVVDMKIGVMAVLYDNPHFFWAKTAFGYSSVNYGDRIVTFGGHYIYDVSTLESRKATIEAKINDIFSQTLKPGMTEGERALALHNWIVENTVYNQNAVTETGSKDYPESWSAYGALIDGTAVCEGLSKAYQLLLYRAGINCTVAISSDHMWNCVNIDGQWYYSDVTWADRDVPGQPNLLFYNQTKEVMSHSRTFCPNIEDMTYNQLSSTVNFNFNLPECTATAANWFYMNGLVFDNMEDFSTNVIYKIAEAANNGEKYIQVMIKGVYFTSLSQVGDYVSEVNFSAVNNEITSGSNRIYGYGYSYNSNGPGFIITWN